MLPERKGKDADFGTYTKKNYVLFIWNSNLALYPVFYMATIVRKGYIAASDDYMS